jgi:phosphoadenosine phosphosulfate reductase
MVGTLETAHPSDVLAWALDTYRRRVVLACSFGGPTGMVALDMAMRLDRSIPVYVLDTGLLFEETHDLIERVRRHYGIEPVAVSPKQTVAQQNERYGDALWSRNPDFCCTLRKLEPQREFLRGYAAWISAVRRDQTPARRSTPVVGWDANFGLVKISPFVRWTEAMAWEYLRERGVPYNELHERGFPSVGCVPCTRAVRGGEAPRDGRWPGLLKTECGLHAPRAIRGAAGQ